MGIKSIITAFSLAALAAPSLEAQRSAGQRQRAVASSAYRSPSYARAAHQRVRSSSHRSQRSYGYASPVRYAPQGIWIPGCNQLVPERYWVQESYERIWVDAVYGWSIDACGIRIRVCTQPGYWSRVHVPGHYATRQVQRWVPGHWKSR